jgi:hypothetical protein
MNWMNKVRGWKVVVPAAMRKTKFGRPMADGQNGDTRRKRPLDLGIMPQAYDCHNTANNNVNNDKRGSLVSTKT